MATSQAALATTAAGGGGSTTGTTTGHSQTIVGWHVFKIDDFSATKNLGVGKSIKSSTFHVGWHGWYIECYPCGDVEENAGWVSLVLRRQDDDYHGGRVSGHCEYTLMDSLKDGSFKKVNGHPSRLAFFADYDDRDSLLVTDFIKREELEWLLEDDCFQVRCVVFIDKFPAALPTPDLASETMAWSHMLKIDDGYSKTRKAFVIGEAIKSSMFRVGGHSWHFNFYPCAEYEDDDGDRVCFNLFVDNLGSDDEVKIRFEITLLTHAGQIISSIQDFSTFTERSNEYFNNFLTTMTEHESSPLFQDGIQIRCDIAVVNGISASPNLHRGIGSDIHGRQQVRGEVTFEVAGHLFAAHKCVLTTRCTAAFMTEFFGSSGNEKTGATDHVHVDMEPRLFEALLHFIYTDTLPQISKEEDKVAMAQGLLVAADRYSMERLKLICDDLLCSYINDARTAVTTLNIADKLGCRSLKETCMKFLMDHFA